MAAMATISSSEVPVSTSCGAVSASTSCRAAPAATSSSSATARDTLRDTWSDMTNDVISGFDTGQSIDILNSLVGRSSLSIAYNEDSTAATLTAGGNSVRPRRRVRIRRLRRCRPRYRRRCAHHDHLRQLPARPAGRRACQSGFHQRHRQRCVSPGRWTGDVHARLQVGDLGLRQHVRLLRSGRERHAG